MKFYIQWDITNQCNLKCKHCYKNKEKKDKELDIDDYTRICEIIKNTAVQNNLQISISITGGEPFMKRKELFSILHYLENNSVFESVQILTNGLLINEDDIRKLKKIKKLRGIQISLESPMKEIHEKIRGVNTFDRTLEIINKLSKNAIKTYVMMTVSKLNYLHIKEMYYLLRDNGASVLGIERFIPETEEEFNRYVLTNKEYKNVCQEVYKLSKNEGMLKVHTNRTLYCLLDEGIGGMCSAGKTALAIIANGDILPCRRLPIIIGNIFKDGIVKVWNESEVLKNCRDFSNLKGKCKNCEFINKCSGCRAMAYAMRKDYLEEDPLCWKV